MVSFGNAEYETLERKELSYFLSSLQQSQPPF